MLQSALKLSGKELLERLKTTSPEHYQKLVNLYDERASAIESNLAQTYIPNGKAQEFIKMVGADKYFVNMFVAANGVGKSSCGANILCNIIYGPQNEYFQLPIFQKWPYLKRARIISDPTTIKTKIVPELKKWFPANDAYKIPVANYEEGKEGKNYVCKFVTNTGWDIDIMSTEQEAKEFESADVGLLWIDEPMPKDKFVASLARGRMGMIVIWTFTPLTYSAWIKDWMDEHTKAGDADYVEAEVEDNCFGENTEILTSTGWRDLAASRVDDLVATFDMDTQTIEYERVTGVIQKFYEGDVIDFGLGLRATPDHRMVVLKENGVRQKRTVDQAKLVIQFAGDMRRGVRLLGAAQNKYQSIFGMFSSRFDLGDWCEFLGWYLSEGCTNGVKSGNTKKNQIYISQNPGEKKERIRGLLERMGFEVHERKGDLWFTDKELHGYLLPLGDSNHKRIPREVFNYPPECLQRLWDAAVLGDGDGKNRYITSSFGLADDFQELLFRMGALATVRRWKTKGRMVGNYKQNTDLWCVKLCRNGKYYPNAIKKVFYSGTVSCVSVPNGTIVVRDKKEKYPLITGNCRTHGTRGILEHANIKRMVDAMPEDEKQSRAFGKFGHLIGRVHKLFRRKIHVIRPFPIDPRRFATYKALDPHPRVPDHVLYMSVNSNGTKYITGEVITEGRVKDLFMRMKAFEEAMNFRIEGRLIDPSAFVDDQHRKEKSVGSQLYDLGETWTKGSKDLMAGIKRTNDALHYEMIEGKMIRSPEIYFFDTCPIAIKQIDEYVWQEWKGQSKDVKQLNAHPRDVNDHNVENLHRLLLSEPVFVPFIENTYGAQSGQNYNEEEKNLDPYG